MTQVVPCFHIDMSAFLGAWASDVYSRSNLAADYLSRQHVLPTQGLMRPEHRPQLVWDNVPRPRPRLSNVVAFIMYG